MRALQRPPDPTAGSRWEGGREEGEGGGGGPSLGLRPSVPFTPRMDVPLTEHCSRIAVSTHLQVHGFLFFFHEMECIGPVGRVAPGLADPGLSVEPEYGPLLLAPRPACDPSDPDAVGTREVSLHPAWFGCSRTGQSRSPSRCPAPPAPSRCDQWTGVGTSARR